MSDRFELLQVPKRLLPFLDGLARQRICGETRREVVMFLLQEGLARQIHSGVLELPAEPER